jgi:hypothetical protein
MEDFDGSLGVDGFIVGSWGGFLRGVVEGWPVYTERHEVLDVRYLSH